MQKAEVRARPRAAKTRPVSRKRPAGRALTIVGVGASAGGLEAFTSLLSHVGTGEGMALVLIQHLDPTHVSLLREALAKSTRMPVVQACHGMRVEPGHVYVIPPNTRLGILDGRLTLAARADDPKLQRLPVDYFFRTLAADRGSRAIGVVLSGTASDGTEGLRAIKAADGITFAQDPHSAKFPGMPESAVAAGVVDSCLPLPELARELVRLCRHPYVIAPSTPLFPRDAAVLGKIFALVRAATGVDFSEYKVATLERRIARRMALGRVATIAAYVGVLETTPTEVHALYEDALIHVTSFFRDPETFESLSANILPTIVKDKPERAPLRVWVAGCATGEEVYSLAIAILEFVGPGARPIQLFGTDVSHKSIELARAGVYPESALRDMSDERRRRYFTKIEGGYRIVKAIRELCVFVQHDLARDPPFSKIDITSCRNVLIYFGAALQKRVVPTLHYSLLRPGYLILGRAESIPGFRQLFEPVDKANKIFARTALASTLHFTRRIHMPTPSVTPNDRPRLSYEREGIADDLPQRLDRLLLGRYAPAGVAVNDKFEVLQFRGETGDYLQPAPGEPQNNLLQMARGGLAMTLRAAVKAANKGATTVRAAGVDIGQDGRKRYCDVVVIPLLGQGAGTSPRYLILFEPSKKAPARGARVTLVAERGRGRAPKLEQELAATREYLSDVISQHGRVNEELGTANEELVSGNEELQSMNEELETAKEELQSTNEELTTVNDELQSRNHEVVQTNSDLVNLLATVDLPILMLDVERRIRLFTPTARRILNVVSGDIGRAFGDIKPNLDVPDFDRQIADVIETRTTTESEVQDREGHWYRLRIRPYTTTDDKIDGAIVLLVDIDALKHHVRDAERAGSDAERANHTKDDFLATLSHELRTPLSSMLLRAQQLRVGGMDDEGVKRAAKSIETGVKRQLRLVDDLLDVSRIVAHKLTMYLQPVDLAQVIGATIAEMRPAAERKSQDLELHIVDGRATIVNGDDTRLRQVVMNLLANAIKFTPDRGKVMVTLSTDGATATIRVRDTGIGIDGSFLPTVFDRFTQQSSTSTRDYGGLGLGLALVRHLVELHHGTVSAASPGRDQGSTFSVTLPLMKTRGPAAARAPTSSPDVTDTDVSSLKGLRILVVDDDPGTREAIVELLGRTHAEVSVAASSVEALRSIAAVAPDLLICDIAMPGEDGYTFIRKVRGLGGTDLAVVPALALTAMAREEDRAEALAAGFQLHLTKPVDSNRLTAALVELAGARIVPSLP
jgi:chemotaxis methyl-accepting protein methylase/signal transduction histidine kinase/chemotaxis response regulator CheB